MKGLAFAQTKIIQLEVYALKSRKTNDRQGDIGPFHILEILAGQYPLILHIVLENECYIARIGYQDFGKCLNF